MAMKRLVITCYLIPLLLLSHGLAWADTVPKRKGRGPLQIFILAGQSNMQGHANVSTLDSLADDPKTAPILKEMRNADGIPRVCQKVWISSVGCAGDGYSDVIEQTGKLTAGFGASPSEIGPEYTFGIYMEKRLNKPILIIKTSWGGRNLMTDFRPPSAGLRVFNDYTLTKWKERGLNPDQEAAKNREQCGVFYRHMIEHVHKVLGTSSEWRRNMIRSRATSWPVLSGFRGLMTWSTTGRIPTECSLADMQSTGNCWHISSAMCARICRRRRCPL